MINVISELSRAGNDKNEDYIWKSDNCVVLFDGATSLVKGDFDAVEFIKLFIEKFSYFIKREKSLIDAVNLSVNALSDYVTRDACNGEYFPSAAAIFVYEHGDTVEMINLGDCTAVVNGKTQTIIRAEDSVRRFDDLVIERLKQLRAETGRNIIDIMKDDEIKEMLISNRKRMNQPDGYAVLSFNSPVITEDRKLFFDKQDVESIVMYSDGFDLLEEDIVRGDSDFNRLYDELRTQENNDSECNVYPRFKVHDDASIVKIKFT